MVLLEEAIGFTKHPGSPPWITFLTLFATMWVTLYFIGPPKPGANQAKERAPPTQFQRLKKLATTVIIPWGMLAKFLYTVVITLLTAYELAMAESGPLPFGESCSKTAGVNSCDSAAAGVFRGLLSLLWLLRGPGYAVGAAGLVSKWGATYQLVQLYYGHYRILYAHQGAHIAEEKRAAGDPLPVEQRYGIAAGFQLAGHAEEDWQKGMVKEEGYAKLAYSKAVSSIGLLFVGIGALAIWIPLLYSWWFSIPSLLCLMKLADCFKNRIVSRAKAKARAAPEAASDGPDAIAPLKDGDAIFYLMLEWKDDRRLVFAQDIDESIVPEVKVKEGYFPPVQQFTKGEAVCATAPLTYKALCGKTEKVEVSWTVTRPKSTGEAAAQMLLGGRQPGQRDADVTEEIVKAMVPVSMVEPVFSSEDANTMYNENFPVFQQTGVMVDGWESYFWTPLACWWVEVLLVMGGLIEHDSTKSLFDFWTGAQYINSTLSSAANTWGTATSLFIRVF